MKYSAKKCADQNHQLQILLYHQLLLVFDNGLVPCFCQIPYPIYIVHSFLTNLFPECQWKKKKKNLRR